MNPSEAKKVSLSYSTSNANIATVTNGIVTAIAKGEATITATAGGKSAEAVITILPMATPEDTEDLLEWFVGWPTLKFFNDERGNHVSYDFKLKNIEISELSDISVSIYKGDNKIATNVLKNPLEFETAGLSGSFYTNDIKETSSWYVEKISGALGEEIFDKLELRAVYNGMVYIVNETELRSIIGKVKNLTQYEGYNTIQEAITTAKDGDRIVVSAEKYDENITIDKSIKLYGANSGINPNNSDWSLADRRAETVFTGFIVANANVENVEIDGFKFTKGSSGVGGVLDFRSGGYKTIKVSNCIVQDTYADDAHGSSGFMYVTSHAHGNPRSENIEFVNNRLINTHGSNTAGTSGVLVWNANNIKVNGNYFYRENSEAGMTSNAALNLLGQNGTMEIRDNYFDDMIIKLDGTKFTAECITGNVFTGRAGKSNILEFTTIRTLEEIEFLKNNNTYSSEGLGYVAMHPVRIGDKGYTTLQGAINAATTGDNNILVYPGNYGADSVDIVQKAGVNIILEAVGDVVLKNQIRIDGGGRYGAEDKLTIKGFTFDFSEFTEGDIIATAKIEAPNYVYTHNVFIEDCTFIGNEENTIVAVRAAAQGGHTNFIIKNCTGLNLHSLAQLTSVNGVRVIDCSVSGGESGLNLNNSTNITISNLTVDGKEYGVRAGQSSAAGIVATNTMIISDSNIKAKYPIWLRNDASGTVVIISSKLTAIDDGIEILNDAGSSVLIDPPVYNKDLNTYYTTVHEAVAAAEEGNTILISEGDYELSETLVINKPITVQGVNKEKVVLIGSTFIDNTVYLGNGATLKNVTVTRDNSEWNEAQNKNKQLINFYRSNGRVTTLEGCIITGGRNGVYINDKTDIVIKDNLINNNRTGIQIANSCCVTVENNTITDNHTIGVLLLYLSADNYGKPTFTGNTIKNNWYSDFENRWPTEYVVDLNANTFTDTTYKIADGSGEPGYNDLHPVELGGDATRPDTRVTFVSKIDGNIKFDGLQLVVATEEN